MTYYRLPPKEVFCHTISYESVKLDSEGNPILDNWQKPEYESTTIENVWFNLSTKFSRGGINSSENAPNASVTMFYRYCGNLPVFEVNTKIRFNGEEYTINLSKPLILKGEAIGWRLEVT